MNGAAAGPREPHQLRLLIVGPVTLDVFDDRVAAGGAVTYAARCASAFGVRAHILTAAQPGFDRSPFDGHELHAVDADATLAFRHRTVEGRRHLRVIDDAGWTLSPLDLPPEWPAPDVLLLAPLLPDDIDVLSFLAMPGPRHRGLIAQGVLREVGAFGEVHRAEAASAILRAVARPDLTAFVSQEDLDEDAAATPTALRALVVTRGAAGVDVLSGTERLHVDAAPLVDPALDDTGAGDVFATAFMLALETGVAESLGRAAEVASVFAGAKLERLGPAPLPTLSEVLARREAVYRAPTGVGMMTSETLSQEATRTAATSPRSASRARLGRVIAFANQKGGVGKTTSTVSVGAALAALDMRVLIVDSDPQANATSALGQRRPDTAGLYEVLVDDEPIESLIVETDTPQLWLLPTTPELAGVEVELVNAEAREFRLRRAVQSLRDEFDFIFIDCPPSLGLLTVNALAAADEVIIPVQTEYLALEGLGHLNATIERVRASLNPRLTIRGVLLTMFDSRTNLARQVEEEVRRHFTNTFHASVPRSVRLSEAPSHGEPIQRYDPSSTGAAAYNAVAAELLERLQEEMRGEVVATGQRARVESRDAS